MADQDQNTLPLTEAIPTLPDEQLNKLADTAFAKMARQCQGELLVSVNDFQLLESLNRQTLGEYQTMGESVRSIDQQSLPMRNTYQAYRPELEQIDAIVKQVQRLSEVARQLDSYTKALEAHVDQMLA